MLQITVAAGSTCSGSYWSASQEGSATSPVARSASAKCAAKRMAPGPHRRSAPSRCIATQQNQQPTVNIAAAEGALHPCKALMCWRRLH